MGKKEEAAKRALARNPNQKKDFHTKRQKVGKKKRAPTNQTNTLVKAKRKTFVLFSNFYTLYRNKLFIIFINILIYFICYLLFSDKKKLLCHFFLKKKTYFLFLLFSNYFERTSIT